MYHSTDQALTRRHHQEIPAEDAIVKAGREILDNTASWKQGKTYQKNTVKTFHRSKGPKDAAGWYARVSENTKEDATFEEFWSKLGVDKAENEMQYVPSFFPSSLSVNIRDAGSSLTSRRSN